MQLLLFADYRSASVRRSASHDECPASPAMYLRSSGPSHGGSPAAALSMRCSGDEVAGIAT